MATPDSTHASGCHLSVPGPGKEVDLNLHYHVATTGSTHESHLSLPDPWEGDLNLYHDLLTTGSTDGVHLSAAGSSDADLLEARPSEAGQLDYY